jgi:threonine dehydrogenase-like Zn-dependent dehydrogenase
VLVTAATPSNEPMHQAALMCRKRGRIVLVGVTGLELSRDDFFKKELTFQVSASYGPGRYDPDYEEKGQDYPVGFVRWTEQRNFEAVLDMLADGRLNVQPLISHRFGTGSDGGGLCSGRRQRTVHGDLAGISNAASGDQDYDSGRCGSLTVRTGR